MIVSYLQHELAVLWWRHTAVKILFVHSSDVNVLKVATYASH